MKKTQHKLKVKLMLIVLAVPALLLCSCSVNSPSVSTRAAETEGLKEAEESLINSTYRKTEANSVDSTSQKMEESFVDSTYQEVGEYSWQDLYVIMILAVQTTPLKENNQPVFSLFQIPGTDTPFLLTGLQDAGSETGTGNYYLYVTDNGKLYELLEFHGTIMWDIEKQAFYLTENQDWYTYEPHFLIKSHSEEPQQLKSFSMQLLTEDADITTDNIASYLKEAG